MLSDALSSFKPALIASVVHGLQVRNGPWGFEAEHEIGVGIGEEDERIPDIGSAERVKHGRVFRRGTARPPGPHALEVRLLKLLPAGRDLLGVFCVGLGSSMFGELRVGRDALASEKARGFGEVGSRGLAGEARDKQRPAEGGNGKFLLKVFCLRSSASLQRHYNRVRAT